MNRGTATARRLALRRLLARQQVASQKTLVKLLARQGFQVTQTTVSRDLAAIGAGKNRVAGGGGYAVRRRQVVAGLRDEQVRLLREFVQGIEASGNLVLLKTSAGAAGPVAAAIDGAPPKGIIGTVAGDDTVLVVTKDSSGGAGAARRLIRALEK